MSERLAERFSGRATIFNIYGKVEVEELAVRLCKEIGCEFDLSRNIRGVVYGFSAKPPHFAIFGSWKSTGENFEIITGVNHHLYDSYKPEYTELLSKIRNVVTNA